MKTSLFAAVAPAALVASLGGCGLLETPAKDTLLIAADLPLTGTGSDLGGVYANALRLSADQLEPDDASGREVQLRLLDNRGDPRIAAANLQELADDRAVDAIIAAGCPDCVVAMAERLTVPVISLDPAKQLVDPTLRWVFRMAPDADDDADLISLDIASRDATTIGVIASDDDYGHTGLEAIKAAAARDQLAVVTTQVGGDLQAAAAAVAGWTPPFDPALPQQPPPGPDAVVIWAAAPTAAQIAIALREAGHGGVLYMDSLAGDELFLPGDRLLDDTRLVFTNTPIIDRRFLTSPGAALRRNWWDRYVSTYGVYHLQSSFAADALGIVVGAARFIDGHASRGQLRDLIELTRGDGITGQLQLNASRHNALHPGSLTLLTADERWT